MGVPCGSSYQAWLLQQQQNITYQNQLGAQQNGNWNSSSQIHGNSPNGANQVAATSIAQLQAFYNSPNSLIPINGTQGEPLENTGIKIGEIIAWRMWTIKGDYLGSYSAAHVWPTDEPTSGKPTDYGNTGIWCFKEKSRALHKMMEHCMEGHAYGSIKIWGTIVEYSEGYKAEFAKVVSIDDVHIPHLKKKEQKIKLLELQTNYNVVPSKA